MTGAPRNDDVLPERATVGSYRIEKTLGHGGFGVTYLAKDPHLDRLVALKEYFPEKFGRRYPDGRVGPLNGETERLFNWGLERFSDEAQNLARFKHHPNIIQVYSLLPAVNNTAYIVMAYEEAGTLGQCVEVHGVPPGADLLRILSQLLDGCEAVHEQGILHRDINPNNILMRNVPLGPEAQKNAPWSKASPVIIDFGAARKNTLPEGHGYSALVTDFYSPPEQYSRNSAQSAASDIYSLAATVYFLLTGNAPPAPAARITDALPVVSEQRASSFRPGFVAAVLKGMEMKAVKRPQSIAEWRRLLGPLTLADTGGAGEPRISRRTLVAAAAAGTAGLLAVGGTAGLIFGRGKLAGNTTRFSTAWTQEYGAVFNDNGAQVATTATGAVVAAQRADGSNVRMLALRLAQSGAVTGEWVGDPAGAEAYSILPMPDGGAIVGGTVGGQATLIRLGADWRPQWSKEIGSGSVASILRTPQGLVAGLDGKNLFGSTLTSLADDGSLNWSVSIDKGKDQWIQRIILLSSGQYAILGNATRSRSSGGGDVNESSAWVSLTDQRGHGSGSVEYFGLGAASGFDLAEAQGVVYVTGSTSDGVHTDQRQMFVWAIDGKGATLWDRKDYQGAPGTGRALAKLGDDRLFFAGWRGTPAQSCFGQIGPNGALDWSANGEASTGRNFAIGLALREQGGGYVLGLRQASPLEPLRLVVSGLSA